MRNVTLPVTKQELFSSSYLGSYWPDVTLHSLKSSLPSPGQTEAQQPGAQLALLLTDEHQLCLQGKVLPLLGFFHIYLDGICWLLCAVSYNPCWKFWITMAPTYRQWATALRERKKHQLPPAEFTVGDEIKYKVLHEGYLHHSVLLPSGILPGWGEAQGSAEHTSPLRMRFSADSAFLLLNQTSLLTVNLGKNKHRMAHFKVCHSMLKTPEGVDAFPW